MTKMVDVDGWSGALKDGAVQDEVEAFGRHGPRKCEKLFPKWTPELLDVVLAKT
jgi:hypothetical protein